MYFVVVTLLFQLLAKHNLAALPCEGFINKHPLPCKRFVNDSSIPTLLVL